MAKGQKRAARLKQLERQNITFRTMLSAREAIISAQAQDISRLKLAVQQGRKPKRGLWFRLQAWRRMRPWRRESAYRRQIRAMTEAEEKTK